MLCNSIIYNKIVYNSTNYGPLLKPGEDAMNTSEVI